MTIGHSKIEKQGKEKKKLMEEKCITDGT